MSKKNLFCSLFILIFLIPSKQDPNAKTWERHNTTVQADSIIAAIERGDSIIIGGCEIIGSLRRGREGTLEGTDTIKSFINISFSTFSDSVSFINCYFMKELVFKGDYLGKRIKFSNTTFCRDADFSTTGFGGKASFLSTFHGEADFHYATFYSSAYFSWAGFRRDADFWGATFDGGAYFRYATFDSNTYFGSAKFGGDADFGFAIFRGDAYFPHDTFGGDADFSNGTVGGKGDFSSATFDTNVSFEGATFGGDANFIEATFRKHANFLSVTFGRDANFWRAIFGGYARFWQATFGGDAYFVDATFDTTVSFSDAGFVGQVRLNRMRFKEIDISWRQLEGHLIYHKPTIYTLMRQFEEKRMLGDADGVYLFLKDQERMEKRWYIRYPEYWFIQQTCGYGRKPLRTLILSMIVVFLFALFYTRGNAIQEIPKEFGYRRKRRLHQDIPKGFWKKLWKKFYHPLYFSLHTFIIGVVSDWHPTDEYLKIRIRKKEIKLIRFRSLAMIEGALGWILVIILIISLERTIGR